MIEVRTGSFLGSRCAGGVHTISRLVTSRRSDNSDVVTVTIERIARRGPRRTFNKDVTLGEMSKGALLNLVRDLTKALEV